MILCYPCRPSYHVVDKHFPSYTDFSSMADSLTRQRMRRGITCRSIVSLHPNHRLTLFPFNPFSDPTAAAATRQCGCWARWGVFSRVSLSPQAAGSSPLSLAVPNRLWITAARLPVRSEPVNSQFFLPMAIGRIAFSTGLLSMGKWPVSAQRTSAGQRLRV